MSLARQSHLQARRTQRLAVVPRLSFTPIEAPSFSAPWVEFRYGFGAASAPREADTRPDTRSIPWGSSRWCYRAQIHFLGTEPELLLLINLRRGFRRGSRGSCRDSRTLLPKHASPEFLVVGEFRPIWEEWSLKKIRDCRRGLEGFEASAGPRLLLGFWLEKFEGRKDW